MNLPYQFFESINTLKGEERCSFYTIIVEYAYNDVMPDDSVFQSDAMRALFVSMKAMVDPIKKREKAARERAEKRRREKEADPKAWAEMQRAKKLQAIEGVDLTQFSMNGFIIFIYAKIKDTKLRHEIIRDEYRRRLNSPNARFVDVKHDQYGHLKPFDIDRPSRVS